MSGHLRAIVLVPGAWHGSWCWYRLEPLLRAQGHRVLMPELRATGTDGTSPRAIRLDTWARQLLDLLANETEPALLVGHSRAGIIISRVAELAPERIRRLVYLAAYLLPDGGTVAEEARSDRGSTIASHMIAENSGVTCTVAPEAARLALYGGLDDQVAEFALTQLRPEPLRPLVTPLRVGAERFGRVPRAYVECTRDRVISLAAQRRMQARWPCDPVLTLDCGHSPFLAKPAELAQWLGAL